MHIHGQNEKRRDVEDLGFSRDWLNYRFWSNQSGEGEIFKD